MEQNQLGLLQGILDGAPSPEIDTLYPFVPLTSPGMPLPGPNFLRVAAAMGETPQFTGKGKTTQLTEPGRFLHYLYRRALYDRRFMLQVFHKGTWMQANYLAGHPLNAAGNPGMSDADTENAFGPRPSDVMVVGKHPGRDELQQLRNFCGPASEDLYRAFSDLGLAESDYGDWYVTNVMRFPHLDPNSGSIPSDWVKDCAPLLAQELRIVRPKYILCFGTEAIKEIMGKAYNVSAVAGQVMQITYPVHGPGERPEIHTAKVMGMLHPAAVFHRPESYDDFLGQLAQFWQLVGGGDPGAAELDIDHQEIYTERMLKKVVDEILLDPKRENAPLAMDAEWHGEHQTDENQYLRTIQFSCQEKWARCVVLRHEGGAPAFKPSIEAAFRQLRRLVGNDTETGEALPWDEDTDRIIGSSGMRGGEPCRQTRCKVGGHFFRSDLPRMKHEGLDVTKQYEPHKTDPRRGGWDTALKYHAVNEATRFKLEEVAQRLLPTVPRWDGKLQEWKKGYCAEHKLKADDLEGYGLCPGKILYPYGNYDVDATWRINDKLSKEGGLLDSDPYGNNCWPAYHLHHRASMAFYEMEQVGFVVDRDRVDYLTTLFMETQARLLNELRLELNWPDFNPKSNIQVIAALFGDHYARKRDKNTGDFLPIRPAGAVCLGLTPLTSTGKRPKLWQRLVDRGEAEFYTPSTNKEVLGILGHKNPTARKLRDFKFIAQAMQSTLRAPVTDDESGEFVTDENDNYEYEKGVAGLMNRDGIIRTHLFQTLETARLASRRPNLQNFSKRREDDYKRIIGKDRHKHPIRSMLMVPPGYVGIEADLVGAELAVLAWLSQDPNMIDHVRRSMLPEKHPDHYDIHSQQAVRAFNLTDVVPTKSGMKAAGCPGLRVAAKNVNFGIPYGRSAEAIARQCAEEGVDVTEHDCQLMIDAYFIQYPGTAVFLEECRMRSQDPRWLRGSYGSLRRFSQTNDRGVIGEQHRQAQNFPIQNGVADNVSVALANLWDYRKTLDPNGFYFHFVLQIHDAIILMCKIEHAKQLYDEVLYKFMVAEAPFWPHRLDGTPIVVPEPYHFGIDRELFIHWGEGITEEEAKQYNMPEWMLNH